MTSFTKNNKSKISNQFEEKKAKTNDAWCPTEEEQKILDEGDSDSSVINESDVGFNAKELEAELLGLAVIAIYVSQKVFLK